VISIVNVSEESAPRKGINKYELKINNEVICKFEHNRSFRGLSQCLRDAADACDAHNEKQLFKMMRILRYLDENTK